MHSARPFLFASTILLTALSAGSATEAAGIGSKSSMTLDGRLLIETQNGKENAPRTLREAKQARSGDRLIFLIRYRNDGAARLPGYDFVASVPRGVRILPGRGDNLRISADGGRSWARPDSPLRIDEDGKLRPAAGVGTSHVRLRLDRTIAPGETGTVAYRGLLL